MKKKPKNQTQPENISAGNEKDSLKLSRCKLDDRSHFHIARSGRSIKSQIHEGSFMCFLFTWRGRKCMEKFTSNFD